MAKVVVDGRKVTVLNAEGWFKFLEWFLHNIFRMKGFTIGAQAPVPGLILKRGARKLPTSTLREEMIHHAQFLELIILFAGVAFLSTLVALLGGALPWSKAWVLTTTPPLAALCVWPFYGLIWLAGLGGGIDADGDGDADGQDAYLRSLFETEPARHRHEEGYLARRPMFANFRGL